MNPVVRRLYKVSSFSLRSLLIFLTKARSQISATLYGLG
ncbi:hypothetical protein LEP3755_16170 [Leptolyngbya sp. NIES-3755]|nr:hypothetical protein LEP3755_16170 [Leptolyngbya sp. NIES-3755]